MELADGIGITRRDLTKALFSIALVATTTLPRRVAAKEPPGLALHLRLQAELDAHIRSGQPGTAMTVVDFDLKKTGIGNRLTFQAETLTRLDWPPGCRQRRFRFHGTDPEAAFVGLRDSILAEFSAIYPSGIVGPHGNA